LRDELLFFIIGDGIPFATGTPDGKGEKERDLDILNAYMVGSNPIEAEQTEADRFVRIWKYG
jgi:hypothetical protein